MPGQTAWAPERRLLTTGLVGLITAIAFEGMAIPTVLPATVADLGGLDLYGWAFAAFWLTNLVGIILAGSDADGHGPLRSFVAGVLLFCVGLAVSAAASGMPMVILGRAIQGFGSGAIGSLVYVVIARAYDPEAMPRLLALNSSAWVVPGLVGPALAAQVTEALGWRWVFGALVPLVVVLGAVVTIPVSRFEPVHGRADPGRAIAGLGLAIGSGLVLAALSVGQPALAVPALLAGGALAVAALGRLLPAGTLLVRRGPPAVVATIGVVAFGFFGTESFLPLALTDVRGSPIVVGGLALSAAAVTWTTGAWIQARLAPRGWRRGLVGTGTLLIAAGIGLAAAVLLPAVPTGVAAIAWAIAGLGMGLAYSTLTLLVLETATPGQEGRSSAALQLMFTLGVALGAGAGGALVALGDHGVLPLALAIGLTDGVMLLAILGATAMVRRIPSRRGEGTATRREPAPASPGGVLGGASVEEP